MCNRLGIRFEFNSDSISQWNAVFHIEEKHLHCITSVAPIRRVSIRSEVKRAMTRRRLPACGSAAIATQGSGHLPMLVPLIASGKPAASASAAHGGLSLFADATNELFVDCMNSGGTGKPAVAYESRTE